MFFALSLYAAACTQCRLRKAQPLLMPLLASLQQMHSQRDVNDTSMTANMTLVSVQRADHNNKWLALARIPVGRPSFVGAERARNGRFSRRWNPLCPGTRIGKQSAQLASARPAILARNVDLCARACSLARSRNKWQLVCASTASACFTRDRCAARVAAAVVVVVKICGARPVSTVCAGGSCSAATQSRAAQSL